MPQRIQSIEYYQILLLELPCEKEKSKKKRGKTQMREGTVIINIEREGRERNRITTINDTIMIGTCGGHHQQ